MGLLEARGNMNKSLKDLMLKWQLTRGDWADDVSERFQEQYIEPIEAAVRMAVSAMDQSAQMISRVDRDCK